MAQASKKTREKAAPSVLTQIRRARSLTLEQVAEAVGTGKRNLQRVENGDQVPKRPLARALYKFYGGSIPLGTIYDPRFSPSDRK